MDTIDPLACDAMVQGAVAFGVLFGVVLTGATATLRARAMKRLTEDRGRLSAPCRRVHHQPRRRSDRLRSSPDPEGDPTSSTHQNDDRTVSPTDFDSDRSSSPETYPLPPPQICVSAS